MEKREFLYEGKAKKLYRTDDRDVLVVEYKDDLTAFNAEKKANMAGKGVLNNKISAWLFRYLDGKGIPHHFIEQVDDVHQLVRDVKIVPLEVIVRNITTGSLCKRLGVSEGLELPRPLLEFCLKNDALGDPIITEDHAILFGWATEEEIARIKEITLQVNAALKELFIGLGIVLVDFKLEFGKTSDGELVLADEISPDTCRFWDSSTGEKLDKDRFRKDLGNVLQAYQEIWNRLSAKGE